MVHSDDGKGRNHKEKLDLDESIIVQNDQQLPDANDSINNLKLQKTITVGIPVP
jgi:hypothetical protein